MMKATTARDRHDEHDTDATGNGAAAQDDTMPADIEDFRRALIRRMNDITREWRICDQPICRRARKCVARNLACSAALSTLTPEQTARVSFRMKRSLENALSERGDKDNGAEKTAGHTGKKDSSGAPRAHQAPKVRPRSTIIAPAAQANKPPQTRVSKTTVFARTTKS